MKKHECRPAPLRIAVPLCDGPGGGLMRLPGVTALVRMGFATPPSENAEELGGFRLWAVYLVDLGSGGIWLEDVRDSVARPAEQSWAMIHEATRHTPVALLKAAALHYYTVLEVIRPDDSSLQSLLSQVDRAIAREEYRE